MFPHLDGVPLIETDNHTGAMMATQHLIDLGHKRIAFVHAVNTLIDTVEGKTHTAPARMPVKLVKRKSTAPPPKKLT